MNKKICIIGAGLAGGILASKLAASGCNVILLEQGKSPTPLAPDDETWEGTDPKSLYARGEGVGGTSNFWHGGLIALDKSDIEGTAPDGAGPKYPISYTHLCTYYSNALRLMTNGEISLEDLLPGKENTENILDESFTLKPLFYPNQPFSTKNMLDNAKQKHGLEIIAGFEVEKLIFADTSHAACVEGFYRKDSKKDQIAADIFVLCAGGIGSPKILLRSAASNPHLQRLPIGKYLIDHPTGFVFKAKLKKRTNCRRFFGATHGYSGTAKKRLGITLKNDCLNITAGRNHVLYLRPASSMRDPRAADVLKNKLVAQRGKILTLWDKLQLIRYPDLLLDAINFKYGMFSSVRYVSGFVFLEQQPEQNAISLRNDQHFTIHWNVSQKDERSLMDFLTAFFQRHHPIFKKFVIFPDVKDHLGAGAHHSGGCRMAASATAGVVDNNLRVFGTDNLFVADGSVLGYAGHANTGLTIAAMALKCFDSIHADHNP